jgi:hypothetical protein
MAASRLYLAAAHPLGRVILRKTEEVSTLRRRENSLTRSNIDTDSVERPDTHEASSVHHTFQHRPGLCTVRDHANNHWYIRIACW